MTWKPRKRKAHTLFFSGGSFRSASACAGVVAYMALQGRWDATESERGVSRVYSVSGGSFLNGALVAAPADENVFETLSKFVHRISADGGRLYRTASRLRFTVQFVLMLAVVAAMVAWAVGLRGPLPAMPGALRVLVGVLVMPTVLIAFRLYFGAVTHDMARVAVGGSVSTAPCDRQRSHVICSAGLSTGTPHLVEWPYWDQRALLRPTWGVRVRGEEESNDCTQRSHERGEVCQDQRKALRKHDEGAAKLTAVKAVYASTALPGAGRLRIRSTEESKIGETLVDGGVVGTFGDSASVASGDSSRTLAIDGSRHVARESSVASRLRWFSYILLVVRWLWVGFEATYINDLEDRRPGRLLRVCMPIDDPQSRFEHRLNDLRQRTSRIGLFGFDLETASVAIVCGAISAAVWYRDLDPGSPNVEREAEEILERLDWELRLGTTLRDAWTSTETAMYFVEQGPFVMSHKGKVGSDGHSDLIAFEDAHRDGYRSFQADLVVDGDGGLVVGHTLLGRAVPGPLFNVPKRAPSWSDVAAKFNGRSVHWNIEVKSNQTTDLLIEFLKAERKAGRLDRYCISAPFRTGLLRAVREQVPEVATNDSIIEGALLGRPLSLRKRTKKTSSRGCQIAAWMDLGGVLTRSALKRDRHVQLWTINSLDKARRAIDRGVAGVISDNPTMAEELEDVTGPGART